MMPAIIWQAQLAWDANAEQPWSHKWGPKSMFLQPCGQASMRGGLSPDFLGSLAFPMQATNLAWHVCPIASGVLTLLILAVQPAVA